MAAFALLIQLQEMAQHQETSCSFMQQRALGYHWIPEQA